MKNPYEIVKSPLITEKLQDQNSLGVYGFLVDRGSNKVEIKYAVEKIYGVNVSRVNIVNLPGKRKRLRFKEGKTSAWKKALVRLKKGQTINLEP